MSDSRPLFLGTGLRSVELPQAGWGAPLSEQFTKLCFVIDRRGGAFLSACAGRWPATGPGVRWTFHPGVDSPVFDRRCGRCAAFVLDHYRAELTPFVVRMLEAAIEPAPVDTRLRDALVELSTADVQVAGREKGD